MTWDRLGGWHRIDEIEYTTVEDEPGVYLFKKHVDGPVRYVGALTRVCLTGYREEITYGFNISIAVTKTRLTIGSAIIFTNMKLQ